MTLDAETRALLTLQLLPGIGPRLTAALLERFGTAQGILQASSSDLAAIPRIGDHLAALITQALNRKDVEEELDLMRRHRVTLRVLGQPDYPAPLATIPDAPHLFFVRGTIEARDGRAVALVGSRQCTPYGKRVAERLAGDLARAGYTVISGLARGIDGAAHRGALQAGGRTLAVLAGGLSRIYPPEHASLADDVEKAGGLISETSMRMEPMAGMFPARNRIISGLSRAVVIIEAAEKSGALITATHAADQGRPVFAIPGPIDSVASGGTNALIRKGATLVRSAEDILEELEGIPAPVLEVAEPRPVEPPPGLDETQLRIWEALEEPKYLDDLSHQLGLAVPQLSGTLMMMEMKKAVRRLPGNRYERG